MLEQTRKNPQTLIRKDFSQELIDETIRCFNEENGVLMTEEQSVVVLNSFADLYLAFAGKGSKVTLKGSNP